MSIHRPDVFGAIDAHVTSNPAHSASNIAIAELGSATYDQLQEVHDLTRSAGHLDGGAITDAGGGNIAVAAGQGFIRAINDDQSTLYTFDWPAPANIAIPDNSIRYVRVNYNAGSPVVTVSATEDYDYRTSFPLGFVIREAGIITVNDTPHSVGRAAGRIARRNYEVDGRSRANQLGGLIISESGTPLTVAVTTGVTWLRGTRDVFPGLDTNVAGSFDRVYRNGIGGWTYDAGRTTLPLGLWDDNSGTQPTINNNNYGNYWVYLGPGNGIIIVDGRVDANTLAEALAQSPPGDLPLRLQVGSLLLGRFTMRRTPGPTFSVVQVESAFTADFVPAPVTDHGGLSGLADNDHPQYALSDHSHGNPTLALTNLSGTTASNSAGLTLSLSAGAGGAGDGFNFIAAGTQTANTNTTVVFSNSNGLTFGMDGSSRVTASHNGLTSQSNQALSAPNGSFTFQTAQFHNSHGILWSTTTGSGIIASHNGLTSQSNQAASASNGSFAFQTLNFSNANNVTFGTSAGSIITASVAAGGGGDAIRGIAAGGSTQTTNTVNFSNSNGVSFGFGAGGNSTVITASHDGLTSQSNQAASAANGSFAFQTMSFSNVNNVSFVTAAGSAIQASIPAGATATGNVGGIVGSNATYTSGTVTLTGVGGGVTVSSNTGQRIDISVAAPVAQTNQTVGKYALQNTTGQSSSSTWDARSMSYAGLGIVSVGNSAGSGLVISATQSNQAASASNGSFTFQTLNFSNANNVTFGTSAGGIVTASVAPGGGAGFSGGVSNLGNTAGTTGTVASQIVFVGANNITLSQSINGNSATISMSAPNPGGGAAATIPYFNNMGGAGSVSKQSQASSNGSIVIVPLAPINDGFPGDITVATMGINLRGGTTQSATAGTHRFFFGIYTRNVSTLSLLNSCSTSVTWPANATATQLLTGDRWLTIHSTNWSSSPVFTNGGRYWLAYMCSSSSQTQGFAWMGMSWLATTGRHGTFGVATTQSNSSIHGYPFMGRYTVANQSQFPAALSRSAISHGVAGGNFIPQLYFYDSNGLSAF